ncbi:MAG: hypothetical protein K6D02_09080 [Lachnospiraceae bacterium]|nr:hypothetical protein [Lachnospiraceae bacterium]
MIFTVFILVLSAFLMGANSEKADAAIRLSKKKVTIKKGKTFTLKVKNNKTKYKTKWTIKAGKKVIRLKSKKKNSVRIYGRKKGKAKVLAKIKKKKLICTINVKAASSNSSTDSDSDTDSDSGSATTEPDSNGYTYKLVPLFDDICYYFYVKTNNPDPDSFVLADEDTVYSEDTVYIENCTTAFSDVKYTDTKTMKVKGGYIFKGYDSDGGTFKIMEVSGSKKTDTGLTLSCPKLYDEVDYLIEKYSKAGNSYFENLSAIQSGFSSQCLYSGVYVLGEQKKSTTSPYYGLSTSPHVDQTFYIQDPYYREGSKSMLVSQVYPFRYDSIGFPSMMSSIAKKLDSKATVAWSSSAHYLVNVTYDGVTKSYGGQGNGGGQGITEDLIDSWYTFDNSSSDLSTKTSFEEIEKIIRNYGAMEVKEEETDLTPLTWADVRNTVGEGSYVRLVLINSIFGGSGTGFTYLYDNNGSTGYFSDAWYDGRYFNNHEFFSKGVTFDTASKAAIIVKDPVIHYPDDGKSYYYNYTAIDKLTNYNPETGVFKGYVKYYYDSDSGNWISSIYTGSKYYDSGYKAIEDEDFKAACTLTLEDVKAMNVDGNCDKDPDEFFIYDMESEPGTKVSGSSE